MDKSEKDRIVQAFFSAAEAMLVLEKTRPSHSKKKVVPFTPNKDFFTASLIDETNAVESTVLPAPISKDIVDDVPVATPSVIGVMSAKTGVETFSLVGEELDDVGDNSSSSSSSAGSEVVYWEDLEKHQWILDVLADLEVYASENSLAETAEALVAARCELISLASRAH